MINKQSTSSHHDTQEGHGAVNLHQEWYQSVISCRFVEVNWFQKVCRLWYGF